MWSLISLCILMSLETELIILHSPLVYTSGSDHMGIFLLVSTICIGDCVYTGKIIFYDSIQNTL